MANFAEIPAREIVEHDRVVTIGQNPVSFTVKWTKIKDTHIIIETDEGKWKKLPLDLKVLVRD